MHLTFHFFMLLDYSHSGGNCSLAHYSYNREAGVEHPACMKHPCMQCKQPVVILEPVTKVVLIVDDKLMVSYDTTYM